MAVKAITKRGEANSEPPHSHDFPAKEVVDDGVCAAANTNDSPEEVDINCPCCADDPVGDLEKIQNMAKEIERNEHNDAVLTTTTSDKNNKNDTENQSDDAAVVENKKLVKMGINTAIAIGLHNFPEGLATFVAALADPKVGAILAIAIGIHNIPEGLCVALPIYYATGNRWKAFCWALLSGASEPLAALLGWAILANSFSDDMYAVLFGLVAGMMVIISTRELLPTAHRYDPDDTVVTYSFIAGMVIMAFSLVLFAFRFDEDDEEE